MKNVRYACISSFSYAEISGGIDRSCGRPQGELEMKQRIFSHLYNRVVNTLLKCRHLLISSRRPLHNKNVVHIHLFAASHPFSCFISGMKITFQKWPAKCQISSMVDLTCPQSTSQCSKRSMLLEEFLLLGDK